MAFWFEKGELRRFSRINMTLKAFITPVTPIKDKQVLALGINYFPPSVVQKKTQYHKQLNHWVQHIQEQREVLEPVFQEMVASVVFLEKIINQISKGHNPCENETDWQQILCYVEGVKSVDSLKETAPKTYQFFDAINQKLSTFYLNLSQCLQKATSSLFPVTNSLPLNFEIDKKVANFAAPKFSNIPLVQAIYSLTCLMDVYFDAYKEFIKDYYFRQNPKAWEEVDVNISSGGVSFLTPKRYHSGMRYTAYFYFVAQSRLMTVSTTFVRSETLPELEMECNGFNFEFPESQDQHFLQLAIEQKVIQDCLTYDAYKA